MKGMFMYLFPGILRLERKREPLEKYLPWILLLGLVIYTGAAFWMYSIKGTVFAVYEGFKKTVMLYGAYLIMIELAPDFKNIYPWSLGLIGLSLLLETKSTLMFSTLFFLFLIRLLTKSSGYLTTRWELGFMTLFMVAEFIMSPFNYPLLLGIALLLDYRFKHKDQRNIPFVALCALMSLMWIKGGFGIMMQEMDLWNSLLVFIVSILYIFRLSILKTILSFNDTQTNIISPNRVKAAGSLLLLSLMILAIGHGMVYEYLHLWVVLGCISIPFVKDMKKLFLKQ